MKLHTNLNLRCTIVSVPRVNRVLYNPTLSHANSVPSCNTRNICACLILRLKHGSTSVSSLCCLLDLRGCDSVSECSKEIVRLHIHRRWKLPSRYFIRHRSKHFASCIPEHPSVWFRHLCS